MRKEYIYSAGVSALLLGSLFASSYFFPGRKPMVPTQPLPKDKTVEIIWDKEDPPPAPDDQQNDLPKPDKPVSRPVQAPDQPQIPRPYDSVQPLQPPAPFDPNAPYDPNVIPSIPGDQRPRSDFPIIDSSQLDQKPSPRAQIPPQYPFDLRNAGIEGEVVVEFVVDTNGSVRNPYVIRSTQKEFEDAALQAIAKWKFRPGKKSGRFVNAGRVQQLFTFRINQ